MVTEVRSVIKNIEELMAQNDYTEAIKIGKSVLQEMDKERTYEHSISILEKLVEASDLIGNKFLRQKLITQIILRHLLQGNFEQSSSLIDENKLNTNTPQFLLVTNLVNQQSENEDKILMLESIEKQTLFGDFQPLDFIPFLEFKDNEQAANVVEDYYSQGRFNINLVDKNTLLHQTFTLDLGNVEEVNIIEEKKVYKLE